MARFGKPRVLGRILLLLLLIILLLAGGLVWFDYLGLVDAKALLGPAYRAVGIAVRRPGQAPVDSPTLLEDERFAKRLASLDTRDQELDQRESDIERRDLEVAQKAQELEERARSLDDREKSLSEKAKEYENRKVNVDQNAAYLTGMPPARAVEILKAMDDQSVIDILRAVEERARATGEASIVAYWLSLMPADRSATIQRKMTVKPGAP